MDAVSIGPLVLAADRFAVVLAIFLSVTIVSFGILPRERIAQLAQPSMAVLRVTSK